MFTESRPGILVGICGRHISKVVACGPLLAGLGKAWNNQFGAVSYPLVVCQLDVHFMSVTM